MNKKQSEIAEAMGVSQSSVSNWIKNYKEKGASSLVYPKVGGSTRRISVEDQVELVKLLNKGAVQNGYDGDLWTRPRVQHLIKERFGIGYSVRAVGDLLADLGYTVQKPGKRSYKQDPEQVRQWREERLPALKKKR
jgi:transposase